MVYFSCVCRGSTLVWLSLLFATLLLAQVGQAHADEPHVAVVERNPGYRAEHQRRHDAYMAAEQAKPLTHRFPSGVLVRIQRETAAEAARAPEQRRHRPGRFCGAAAFDGVSPPPALSIEEVFSPTKQSERTRFKHYPWLQMDMNITECVGHVGERRKFFVDHVSDVDPTLAGWREVLPFIPEGAVWTVIIPATLFYGTQAIDMMGVADFCLSVMTVRVRNVWSQRLPLTQCEEHLNEVIGYNVSARDAEQLAAAAASAAATSLGFSPSAESAAGASELRDSDEEDL